MHYYKRNLGDYAKKAGRLSMLEHGAYTLLLDACYDRERFPTEAEAIEWAWARTEVEIAAVRFVLTRFFTLTDGVYVQERIAEEVATYQRNAENNARIAKEREEKRKKGARTVHEPCDYGDEAPPNHKPLTTNQEPGTKEVKPARASRKPATDAAPELTVADLTSEGVDKDHAAAWFSVRKASQPKKGLTQVAWDRFKSEARKAGITVAQAVHICAMAEWRGFNSTWNWQQYDQAHQGRAPLPMARGAPQRPPTAAQMAMAQACPSLVAPHLRHLVEPARATTTDITEQVNAELKLIG